MIAHFSDPERGGFFTTPDDHERLITRRKDLEDSPVPSGGSAAAFGLLRLALLSGEASYERQAVGVLRLLYPMAGRHPGAFGHLLRALDFYLAPVREVAIVGPDAGELVRVVRGQYRPHVVLAAGEGDPVARRPRSDRRPCRRLRVRALRLPGAGEHAAGAGGGAGLGALPRRSYSGGAVYRQARAPAIHSAARARPARQSPL